MPLDPQVQDYLKRAAEAGDPPFNTLTPVAARRLMDSKTAMLGEPPTVERVEDRTIDGPEGPIKVRVYTPMTQVAGEGPLPLLVYFHGGGWVLGNIETHDGLARAIANEGPAIVAAVDYRLAPEAPFPAAVEDAYAAVCALHCEAAQLGGDPARLGVGGDSAGGNLAAVVSMRIRDRGGPALAWQLLVYPVIDCDFDTPSYRECADGFGLSRDEMAWYWDQYVETASERVLPQVSPLRADDLSGLPPAFVMTAEYDVLRDEAERYAERLASAGVPVTLKRYDGMIHGFLRRHMFFDAGRAALEDVGRELRKVMKTSWPAKA